MKRILCTILALLLLTVSLTACLPEVPEPAVREGRFDFTVTYEVNGEEITLSGVYVCRYLRGEVGLSGIWREWDGYIEGSDLDTEFELITNEDGVITLDLGLDPMYFMSDPFFDPDVHSAVPEVAIVYHEDRAEELGYFSSDPDLLASYGVRIISYDYASPIENSYE